MYMTPLRIVLLLVIMLTAGCEAMRDPQVQKRCIETVCDVIQHSMKS